MGKKTKKKHDIAVRRRAFSIWQNLGYYPWRQPGKGRRKDRDFYKGAFDSIPFLNDDAKRTFSHLLLRPGYMIRDYIGGKHDKYLAPLTSLIVFYAFFALIAAILQPIQHKESEPFFFDISDAMEGRVGDTVIHNTVDIIKRGYIFLKLDQYPEEVDTRFETAVAALEGKLRSQGIPLFLGKFFFLWLSLTFVLRKYKISMSAAAAASAYILCQFSFFMLFAVLFSFGESTSIGLLLMAILMTFDLHQWLGVSRGRAFKLTVKTGLVYLLLFVVLILIVSLLIVFVAWLKARQ